MNVAESGIADGQRALGLREGFDVGLEMSGAPAAVEDLLKNMNHGGRVAMLGLPKDPYPIDWGRLITHMITIKGIYGREMYDTWYSMSSMLGSSEVLQAKVLIQRAYGLPFDYEWTWALAAAGIGVGGGLLGALYPAVRAARQDAVSALSYE